MADDNFFPKRTNTKPTIYIYDVPELKSHIGYIKIGYTDRDVPTRVKEQTHTVAVKPRILFTESAMCPDGSIITDGDIFSILKRKNFTQLYEGSDDNEWYKCTVDDVKAAILELKQGIITEASRTATFKMRPEQKDAVIKTKHYFISSKKEEPDKSPRFLWNAKMRFGKTFASYQLAKDMKLKRILILTFKPAVESAWREDLLTHVDFNGWQFISNKDTGGNHLNIDEDFEKADKSKPIVVFGSFQDLLGLNDLGGIKAKNKFIHSTNWDLVIFDEYHFGAWRENAKRLFDNLDEEKDTEFDAERYQTEEAGNAYNESFLPITTDYYLFLSGTPFRALNSGEFIEEQIFNWTYTDEQKAKNSWTGPDNPYISLPRMVMMTYQIPDSIKHIAEKGEFNEFDLNIFFSAEGKEANARFIYENEVQKWLDLIRGAYLPANVDNLKLGDNRPPMPFSDTRLLNILSHTLWFLPNVASCYAMYNLMQQKQNNWFNQNYKIHICAGTKAGVGLNAVKPIRIIMEDPLKTRTITLSCGKLTTGVTVKPWTGVFMLRNLNSPETYFQTAFRVQSPWTIKDEFGKQVIIKQKCYVFDFALDRALKQISDYSCKLDPNESNPEKKVNEFISFLPVLAYDGSSMKQINAQEILDITLAGTSATLLARRWESALLVNVDNETLQRLLDNEEAMKALMNIESFRSLNKDIQTIIAKSEKIKKFKGANTKPSEKVKKMISDEDRELKSKRKEIQKQLIKFATRIPVFMYLTDFRERSLRDIITQLEPTLFKKVTGIAVKDFELLCSLGVFNSSHMNDAIFKFKRYEDESLSYSGIDKRPLLEIGGWDTTIKREEYDKLFHSQQETMSIRVKSTEAPKALTNHQTSSYVLKTDTTVITNLEQETLTELETAIPNIKINSKVNHKKFGTGIVAKLDKKEKYITVSFGKAEKKFIYPNAFLDGFLTKSND